MSKGNVTACLFSQELQNQPEREECMAERRGMKSKQPIVRGGAREGRYIRAPSRLHCKTKGFKKAGLWWGKRVELKISTTCRSTTDVANSHWLTDHGRCARPRNRAWEADGMAAAGCPLLMFCILPRLVCFFRSILCADSDGSSYIKTAKDIDDDITISSRSKSRKHLTSSTSSLGGSRGQIHK